MAWHPGGQKGGTPLRGMFLLLALGCLFVRAGLRGVARLCRWGPLPRPLLRREGAADASAARPPAPATTAAAAFFFVGRCGVSEVGFPTPPIYLF